jgi:hypothetical protein
VSATIPLVILSYCFLTVKRQLQNESALDSLIFRRNRRRVLYSFDIGLRGLTNLLNSFGVGRTVFLGHIYSVAQRLEPVCRTSQQIPTILETFISGHRRQQPLGPLCALYELQHPRAES